VGLCWPVFEGYRTWIVQNTRVHAAVVHVRGNADAVALLRGGEAERRLALAALDVGVSGGARFLWLQEAADFAGALLLEHGAHAALDWALCEAVWAGACSFGRMQLLRGLLFRVCGEAQGLCRLLVGDPGACAGLARLSELVAEMDAVLAASVPRLPSTATPARGLQLEEAEPRGCALELRGVALRTPARARGLAPRTLYDGLSLQLPPGDSLVVVGASGVGKSSLLRAVAGLWCTGAGSIRRVADDGCFFAAQRPYACVGTLRAQLLYPRVQRQDVSDERLCAVLKTVQLEHLLLNPGLDDGCRDPIARADELLRLERSKAATAVANGTALPGAADDRWWNKLSLGEMQRISFARLLLREGLRLVFLDEATSALSPSSEASMYKLLRAHAESYVSVAHRPQVRSFHRRALELRRGEGAAPASCRVLAVAELEAGS